MRFSKKKGRPKSTRTVRDVGTPEFRDKQRAGYASDPLLWCLRHQRISQDQYDVGSRLRWLYTTQYGTMTPRTVEWGERPLVVREDVWVERRKEGLKRFDDVLSKVHCRDVVYQICVFHEWPAWLGKGADSPEIRRLKRGLSQLLLNHCL